MAVRRINQSENLPASLKSRGYNVGRLKRKPPHEHSCPSCGFEADRDYNASVAIKRLGVDKLGVEGNTKAVGQGMAESTPAETALPGDTEATADAVSPKRVVETGSSSLKEVA